MCVVLSPNGQLIGPVRYDGPVRAPWATKAFASKSGLPRTPRGDLGERGEATTPEISERPDRPPIPAGLARRLVWGLCNPVKVMVPALRDARAAIAVRSGTNWLRSTIALDDYCFIETGAGCDQEIRKPPPWDGLGRDAAQSRPSVFRPGLCPDFSRSPITTSLRHSGIAYHTSVSVHRGTTTEVRAQRATFIAAFKGNPARSLPASPSRPSSPPSPGSTSRRSATTLGTRHDLGVSRCLTGSPRSRPRWLARASSSSSTAVPADTGAKWSVLGAEGRWVD